ncbi:MAG: GNAT family N-acetyltransferase [Proteobacteria bacterium]|nr:GNAT family N-acetyltransferase [Pseudomonadota bacterium]
MQAVRGAYFISDDRSLLDFDVIHGFLSGAYWAPGVPREIVERAAEHSQPFGLYLREDAGSLRQIGYMRVLTDYAAIGYVLDVFVLESFRGHGLGRWLVQTALAQPAFAGIRTWVLTTKDAQALYRTLGFTEAEAGRFMTRRVRQPWQIAP